MSLGHVTLHKCINGGVITYTIYIHSCIHKEPPFTFRKSSLPTGWPIVTEPRDMFKGHMGLIWRSIRASSSSSFTWWKRGYGSPSSRYGRWSSSMEIILWNGEESPAFRAGFLVTESPPPALTVCLAVSTISLSLEAKCGLQLQDEVFLVRCWVTSEPASLL